MEREGSSGTILIINVKSGILIFDIFHPADKLTPMRRMTIGYFKNTPGGIDIRFWNMGEISTIMIDYDRLGEGGSGQNDHDSG
jgi:hypothetical protein